MGEKGLIGIIAFLGYPTNTPLHGLAFRFHWHITILHTSPYMGYWLDNGEASEAAREERRLRRREDDVDEKPRSRVYLVVEIPRGRMNGTFVERRE